jgi:sporulation protein YlmC with PRC-barrel domain
MNNGIITARSLAKKTVTLSDGTVIGKLYHIIADLRTGEIQNILVRPLKEVPGIKMEDGLYVIPFESVKAIGDYIIIDKRKVR